MWPIAQLTHDPHDPWPMTHDHYIISSYAYRTRRGVVVLDIGQPSRSSEHLTHDPWPMTHWPISISEGKRKGRKGRDKMEENGREGKRKFVPSLRNHANSSCLTRLFLCGIPQYTRSVWLAHQWHVTNHVVDHKQTKRKCRQMDPRLIIISASPVIYPEINL